MIEEHVELAMMMYDCYCKCVGGKAYNGDPLPTAEEMWSSTDEKKRKVCSAWEDTAVVALTYARIGYEREPLS